MKKIYSMMVVAILGTTTMFGQGLGASLDYAMWNGTMIENAETTGSTILAVNYTHNLSKKLNLVGAVGYGIGFGVVPMKADLNYGITNKPLKVLANGNINGVDFSHFDYHLFQEYGLQAKHQYELEGKLIFLNIGRMVKDKGIVELVRSFIRLFNEGNNVALVLVGSLEQDLDPLPDDVLDALERHPGITWVGYQSDVRPFIAMSDVLIFPSYREGFPNVPLQCGAFRKAMVLSDINGCNEIITHYKNGLLVKPKSEEEVYSAMLYMLKNPEKRNNFGREAYAHIKENFEQDSVWEAQLAAYHSLIKK